MYLRPNVLLEPLYQQWYAWPHLISPATAAMNVVNRHLKILDSYLKAPSLHERFARDPKMLGSPFMATDARRVDEVRELRDRTRRDYAQMIAFAEAVVELNNLLREHAHGYSLEELYPQVPEPLRGYVELFYDLDNHPAFRFLEALLYRSEYYDASAQSVVLYLIDDDRRPFVLSTPRLIDDQILHLEIPFAHPGLDELFRMRTKPGSYTRVRELLGITNKQEPLFQQLFTEEPLRTQASPNGTGAKLKYFGHACVLLVADGVTILTDPVISYNYQTDVPRYTYSDLPDKIDYVLMTHNHQDHVLLETLLQIRHKVGQVIVPRNNGGTLQDPSMKLMFQALGFRNVVQLDELESLDASGCTITGVPFMGEHADLNIRSKIGYHVALPSGFKVLFVADSNCWDPSLYRHVHHAIGDVDMLFLGMECDGAPLSWLYGPLLTAPLSRDMDRSRRLDGSNEKRGLDLVNQFNPSAVYVYAMGQEPWLRHIMALEYQPDSRPLVDSNALVEQCRQRGIVAKRLFAQEVMTCEI